jgi:4-amino-4-deoxy-L-arabinose transferase-like glycosyltransferase
MDTIIEKHPNKIAAVVGLVVLCFVYWRLLPTLPTVMQDELVYMVQSRHTDPTDVSFPNYLFSWLYSSTVYVGVDFYWYVKLLNFVFLAGFGSIIFLLARQIFGLWVSILVSLAAVAGPASLYGSIFMPEAMYIFFAALSFYIVLSVPAVKIKESWKWVLASGAAIALASLVKPHALFLTVGFALFFILSSKWRTTPLFERFWVAGSFLAASISLKLLGGFILAGSNGVTLFGGYGSVEALIQRFLVLIGVASNTDTSDNGSGEVVRIEATESFLELTMQQFGLHFLAMGFLLAPAWYVFFSTKFSVKSSMAELALLSMGTMMIVISAFGAYVTVTGDDHTDRVLLRYYEFLIPIVYLGAYQVLRQKHPDGILKYIFFGVFLLSAVLISANGIAGDSSYLLGIFDNLDMRWLYSAALVAAFLFILGAPVKLAQYTATTMSLATLFAGISAQQNQLDINSEPIGSDFAGQFVRDELRDVPGEEIFVVGSDKQLVEASIFWMDRPGVDFELYNAGSVLPESQIPENRSVIVQILGVRLGDIKEGDLVKDDWIISYR